MKCSMETQNSLIGRINEYQRTAIVSDSVTDGCRLYVTPDGKTYPSVTTVLSAMEDDSWLADWISRVGVDQATAITKLAGDRGTSMHALIENHFRGKPVDRNALGFPLYKKLRIYLQNIEPLGLELALWSDRLCIAGRTDCIGYYNGVLSVIDYKSSLREKSASQITNYFNQSTIYSLMLLERLNIAAKQIVILIGVDGGFPQEFKRETKNYIKGSIDIIRSFHRQPNPGIVYSRPV